LKRETHLSQSHPERTLGPLAMALAMAVAAAAAVAAASWSNG